MSLTQQETDAISAVYAEVDGLKTAADTHSTALQASVDQLTKNVSDLNVSGTVDKQTIDSLNASIATLQAAADSHSSDVVAGLSALGTHIADLTTAETDAPATTTTPTPTTTTTPTPTTTTTTTPPPPPTPDPTASAQTGQLADLTGHGSTDQSAAATSTDGSSTLSVDPTTIAAQPADASIGSGTPPATSAS